MKNKHNSKNFQNKKKKKNNGDKTFLKARATLREQGGAHLVI